MELLSNEVKNPIANESFVKLVCWNAYMLAALMNEGLGGFNASTCHVDIIPAVLVYNK